MIDGISDTFVGKVHYKTLYMFQEQVICVALVGVGPSKRRST